MNDLVKKARQIINDNLYLSLATSNGNETWIAPLWYAVDKQYNFYFVSEHSSVHCTHIKLNPNVAVSIFNSTENPEDVNGLQIAAKVAEVGIIEMPTALKTVYSKAGSDLLKLRFKAWNKPETYLSLSKFRIYKIVPTHFYILDTSVTDTDKRIEVKLC